MHPVVRAILQSGSSIVNAMRISTSTTGTDYCAFYKNSIFNNTKITVATAIFRVETSGTSDAWNLQVGTGAKYVLLGTKTDRVVFNILGTSPYTHMMNTTDAFHEYTIKCNGTTNFEFYVDGSLIHTAVYANAPSSTANFFYWGDINNAVNSGGNTVWTLVKYNVDYEANPTNFVEWSPTSKPTSQGWSLYGTDLASIITL